VKFDSIIIDLSTICAITTAPETGVIMTIRLSGLKSIEIDDQIFNSPTKGKKIIKQRANSLHFGSIHDHDGWIDDVVLVLFHPPHSYTGKDVVEISCHGSVFILQRILRLLKKSLVKYIPITLIHSKKK
jgi:tRNA modification GTPase